MTATLAVSTDDLQLHRLRPIRLDQLDERAALQTRIDRKYLIAPTTVTNLLQDLADEIAVLEIEGQRRFSYRSLYFDSGDLIAYRRAATGRRRRFKVRAREYVDRDARVLEVKTKGPRGTTVKTRLEGAGDGAWAGRLDHDARRFVDAATALPGLADTLRPALLTAYRRSTVVDDTAGWRMTLDVGLHCATPSGGSTRLVDAVIVETKSPGRPTSADRWLWRHGRRPLRISKFAVGMASLHPDLPAHRWRNALSHMVLDA